ncbi:hypothetical protein SALBM135S_00150 [Streptomyces alboniger]
MNHFTKIATLTGALSALLLAAPAASAAPPAAGSPDDGAKALTSACGDLMSAVPPLAAEGSFMGVCELAG